MTETIDTPETTESGGRPTPTNGSRGSGSASPPHSDRVGEILEAATRLFSEVGYQGVGIRMIADTVGVQPSSLYHHFRSKEEILYRIALRATTEFIDAHVVHLEADGHLPEVLRDLIRAHVVYFGENRLEQQVAERELRDLTPHHYEEVRRRQRQYLDGVVALVKRGVAQGVLDVPHPGVATRAMLDMLNTFNRWFEPRPDLDLHALADVYAELIVGGLLGARRARGQGPSRAEPATG